MNIIGVVKEDKSKKKILRRKTILEYKSTRNNVIMVGLVILIGILSIIILRDITVIIGYEKNDINIIQNIGFSFFSLEVFITSLCVMLEMYLLYNIRKEHLDNDCNLKSSNSNIIIKGRSITYLFKSNTTAYSIYIPYDSIEYCNYNKKFNRIELHGSFYKENRQGNYNCKKYVWLKNLILYDIYQQKVIELLKEENIDIRIIEQKAIESFKVEKEIPYDVQISKEVLERVNNIIDEKLEPYIDEFFMEEERLVLSGITNLIDNKNYVKYYFIRIVIALFCFELFMFFIQNIDAIDFMKKAEAIVNLIIVFYFYKLGLLTGFNGFNIHITIEGNRVNFEEISSVYSESKIIHRYEFNIEDIYEISRSAFCGCRLVVSGDYKCFEDISKIKHNKIKKYTISFYMKRRNFNNLKRALRNRVKYEDYIIESDLCKMLSYYNWQ